MVQGFKGGSYNWVQLAKKMTDFASTIDAGIQKHGIVPTTDRETGRISPSLMFEVDGFSGTFLIDDANVPSLLSLPYLGYLSSNSTVYQKTRSLILNPATNAYAFAGKYKGIGSPHTGRNMIWPISLMIQGMTSTDDNEIRDCMKQLKASAIVEGQMHESFNKDNITDYTRKWFAWANSLFGEFILKLAKEKPYLLAEIY
jgi:hypothetical protein